MGYSHLFGASRAAIRDKDQRAQTFSYRLVPFDGMESGICGVDAADAWLRAGDGGLIVAQRSHVFDSSWFLGQSSAKPGVWISPSESKRATQ